MLSTLLSTIQSTLFGARGFLIAAFVPMLVFAIANFLMFLQVSDQLASSPWISRFESSQAGYFAAAAGLLLVTSAYVFSTLSTFLRETLEGKGLLATWPFRGKPLCLVLESWNRRQTAKLDRIQRVFDGHQFAQRAFDRKSLWTGRLRDARILGRPKAAPPHLPAMRKRIDGLLHRRASGHFIDPDSIDAAVTMLEPELKAYSAALDVPESKALKKMHEDLLRCIEYGADKYEFEIKRVFNFRQFHYPGTFGALAAEDSSDVNVLAPTEMGNVARTVRCYALTRYRMDLDIFWTRLQRVIQTDDKFFQSLQDTKIQLDFLISLCWLTGVFTVGWGIALPVMYSSASLFLLVAVGGPILTNIWYRIACQTYRAFADMLRSSVDLFRLGLLKQLSIPLPFGTHEEQQLWESLNRSVGYDSKTGVTYKHS